MRIETRELGLAAFMKIRGAKLVEYSNRVFVFESDRDLNVWRVEYANSCCYQHDTEVMSLRKFLNKGDGNNG